MYLIFKSKILVSDRFSMSRSPLHLVNVDTVAEVAVAGVDRAVHGDVPALERRLHQVQP